MPSTSVVGILVYNSNLVQLLGKYEVPGHVGLEGKPETLEPYKP